MTLVTPANAKGPVPVLMEFTRAGFPNPNEPRGEELDQINAAWKAVLLQQDPSLKDVFAQHPAWQPLKESPFFQPPQLNADGDPPNEWQLVAAGWGFVRFDPASVQADNGAGLTRGIIGLVNKGQPRKPDDWGALRAWAWGAGRGLDYLETDPAVDAKHVGIEGVSRYGKAALVTMAFDPIASPWCSSAPPAKAEPRCCAATSARAWRISPPASITGWPATSSNTTPPKPRSAA